MASSRSVRSSKPRSTSTVRPRTVTSPSIPPAHKYGVISKPQALSCAEAAELPTAQPAATQATTDLICQLILAPARFPTSLAKRYAAAPLKPSARGACHLPERRLPESAVVTFLQASGFGAHVHVPAARARAG